MTPYHVRRRDKQIDDEAEVLAVLRRGRYATLALCRGDEPYVVTLNYGFDPGERALYFHAAAEGLKLDFIQANPRVCGTVIEDLGYKTGECDHAYRTVVLRGRMRLVQDIEEKKRALDIMVRHLEPDPEPVRRKLLSDEGRVAGVAVLRLDIESMSGKQAR